MTEPQAPALPQAERAHPECQDDPDLRAAQEARLRAAWATPKGWRYLTAVNNTEVGLWYAGSALAFMLFAGALALIMRAQLAVPENDLVGPDFYNQAFTLHGTAMMFLFAVPIFEAVAILILPALLGARELPFPRLSAFGFWCYLIGGVFVCGSILFDAAPDAGWFMYPPLATEQGGIGADIWLLGLSFIEVASIAAAVELIVGVLKCRPPGMRLNLIPLYAWYVLIVGAMILFAFPPLIAGDLLFELERLLDWPFFDPTRGGDPLLWQHLFWIFGHPEVYIIFLPSIALLAMMIPTFAGRPIAGYSWIVLSAMGTGFISFGLWVHHMFTTGLPSLSLGFFAAASEAVAIPTGIQIFVFIATLMLGTVRRSVPMLWSMGALAIFVAGGLTGVMLAIAPFDFQAHDSYFIVAHLHFTLFGGMLFPLVAGIHYYYPLVTGRMLSRRLGVWSFWLCFPGFVICFLPMHLTGMRGMPRRVWTYSEGLGWDTLNLVSSLGAFVFAAGFLVFIWDLIRPKGEADRAPRNPWKGGALEWLQEQPPRSWGVRCVPQVSSRYPLWDDPDFVRDYDAGRFYLPDAEEGRREGLVTSVLDAEPEQVLRIGGPSVLPLGGAAALGGVFIFATFHWWWLTAISGLGALVLILRWVWTGTGEHPEKPSKSIGLGREAALYVSGPKSTGWWAMFITMLGDLTAFLGLFFGLFFFLTVHEAFPPLGLPVPGVVWPMASLGLAAVSWLATWGGRRANAAGRVGAFRALLALALATGLAAAAALAWGPWAAGMDPTAHSWPAIVWALVLWSAAHAGVGAIMQGFCLVASFAGRLTPAYDADIRNTEVFAHFHAFAAIVTAVAFAAFPEVREVAP
ncbi:cytochrome c oxidase subunit I+III [Albimonas donghaensis]|uniref:cytochrome-c oxidase n=1 Tax=Albimonas donghaensis TaxID=356660 RepID=A0A1H3DS82_9RHOB|nr:cytochrome c oxidase subunit I [Albimonas donghaensis]SDX69177.1 cytochrome c oxidase subunit I+III [Albimonas donghaensis]